MLLCSVCHMRSFVRFVARYSTCVLVAFCFGAAAEAQTGRVRPLITQPINETRLQTLRGNTHPLAQAAFDHGAAPVDLPMERMLLVLNRSAAQDTALETLLAGQQNPSSPQFHKWLTPQEFGRQFGAADQDIQTVTSWLQSHGFTVTHVANGKNVIEFSGLASQVEETFHTAIHKYVVNGVEHWANSSDPQLPVALTSAVAGVATLHNFGKKSQAISTGRQFEAEVGARPQFSSGETYALAPADYATIYNINPLYQAGINGAGVTIAVVGRSNINVSDITSFRSNFGLPANNPQVVLNGPDAGNAGGGEEAEAVLDTTWAGVTATSATVKLVVSKTTNTTDGVDLSEQYIIDNNLSDVMTESFGDCETNYSQADARFYSSLAQQAAAEGITYTVAAGDSGAEGCDSPTETSATGGISVNILASTPYTVAVGGTEFNENGRSSTYWAASNSSVTQASALSYIPENVWNESCTVAQCGSANAGLWTGGGGASIYFPKPSWQAGVAGVPNDGVRDVPDVALTAAGHDFYLLCLDGSCTPNNRGRIRLQGYSGTSAATPSFAGILALVVQKTGARLGQADNVLYTLAARQSPAACNGSNTAGLPAPSCIFNDVTIGNNAVLGEPGYGAASALYQAGAAYDQASGLGSVNAANLVNGWAASGGTPAFTVSAKSLNFGTKTIGFSNMLQITVSNPGTGTLYLAPAGISQSATDFSYSKTCGTAIVAGESCQISVTFLPVAPGARTGTLVIASTDGSLSGTVTLTGTGVASPALSITSTTLSFGNQKVLTPGSAQAVTITNSTVQSSSVGTIAIGGLNPEDFAELNTCPATLSPGASCTFYVVFTPQLIGSRSASIAVPVNGGVSQTIPLTGTGTLTGLFEIVNSLTGKVLDITAGSGNNGTLIQQYALDGFAQQQWQFIPSASGSYEIRNWGTGKVLDVTADSLVNGALIQEWDYLGGGNQQWELVPVDDVHYKIVNSLSGKVLDVVGGSSANGAQIQQWTFIGDPQQLWVVVPVGSYNITNALSGDVLDVTGGSAVSGTLVDQAAASGAREQQWQLMPAGSGYYAILNTLTGKVLDVKGESVADGGQIQEWDYLGGANQQWQLVPVCPSAVGGCLSGGGLNFKIVNRLSGKALDDSGYSTTSGTFIQQWAYLGGSNQQWQFSSVVFYTIVNRLSGAALDVPGGSAATGTALQQWAPDGFQQQQWQLVPAAGGSFAITNNLTSQVLDVRASSTTNGALIQEYTYSGGQNQQWQLISVAPGYYEIANSLSGKVLDVVGMSTVNGAAIQQWDYLGGYNQQWQIIPVPN